MPPPPTKPVPSGINVAEEIPSSDSVHNMSQEIQTEHPDINAEDISFDDATIQSSSPTAPLTSAESVDPPALVDTQRVETPGEFSTYMSRKYGYPLFCAVYIPVWMLVLYGRSFLCFTHIMDPHDMRESVGKICV